MSFIGIASQHRSCYHAHPQRAKTKLAQPNRTRTSLALRKVDQMRLKISSALPLPDTLLVNITIKVGCIVNPMKSLSKSIKKTKKFLYLHAAVFNRQPKIGNGERYDTLTSKKLTGTRNSETSDLSNAHSGNTNSETKTPVLSQEEVDELN